MGSKSDMATWRTKLCMNNKTYCSKVNKAWKKIFKKGARINSQAVTKYLEDQSLVPTQVISPKIDLWHCWYYLLECVQKVWDQFFLAVPCQSTAWVWTWCVEGHFHTFSAHPACGRRYCCPRAELEVRIPKKNKIVSVTNMCQADTGKCKHLNVEQSESFTRMCHPWHDWQHMTSKTCYRYVQYDHLYG